MIDVTLARHAPQRIPGRALISSPTARVHVLIIEDSRGMQVALRDLLQTLPGFQVVAIAASEERANKWLLQNQAGWQLAVVDLGLDRGSGFNLLRGLRAINPDGHIIVFSEFATAAMMEKCVALGADAAFLKSNVTGMVRHLEQFALCRGHLILPHEVQKSWRTLGRT